MFKFLKERLVCPQCYNELVWDVLKDNEIKIIKANINCSSSASP